MAFLTMARSKVLDNTDVTEIGQQRMIFSKLSVCDSRVDRMWRHLAC